MADTPRTQTPLDKVIDVAQRAGKWGIAGLSFLMLQAVVSFIEQSSGWHSFRDIFHSIGDMAGTFGICLTLVGAIASIKRGNDMTATIGAESKIDRASIAAALPNAPAIEVLPTSSDPAVQREITKKLNGKQQQMDAAIEAGKLRQTDSVPGSKT